MTLGNCLKKIRLDLKLSQEQFAKLVDVSFTTVNRWENEKSKPRNTQIKIIKNNCSKDNSLLLDSILNNKKPLAFALFAGGGGFHLGMENYFDILVANDIEPTAELTH